MIILIFQYTMLKLKHLEEIKELLPDAEVHILKKCKYWFVKEIQMSSLTLYIIIQEL